MTRTVALAKPVAAAIARLRAEAIDLPASDLRAGDFLSVGGNFVRLTTVTHRGGVTCCEMGERVRVQLEDPIKVHVIRPRPHPATRRLIT
ncbi:hypothetical protein, partial [Streptomyces otsuchiensis]|uniref:hypothetical protein n=1 Tax=Streptomyces otsuchiensis TaxID=2681388 RepID=UPI00102F5DF8